MAKSIVMAVLALGLLGSLSSCACLYKYRCAKKQCKLNKSSDKKYGKKECCRKKSSCNKSKR